MAMTSIEEYCHRYPARCGRALRNAVKAIRSLWFLYIGVRGLLNENNLKRRHEDLDAGRVLSKLVVNAFSARNEYEHAAALLLAYIVSVSGPSILKLVWENRERLSMFIEILASKYYPLLNPRRLVSKALSIAETLVPKP